MMDEQRAWLKLRRGKRLRLLSAALCIILLVTMYPKVLGTLPTLAVGMWGEDDTLSVSRFVDLPDEVREQTVPVGTDRSVLELPDTLEAYVAVETEDGTEDDAGPGDGDRDEGEDSGDGDNNSGETPEGGDNNGGETPEGGGNNGGGPPEGGGNNGGETSEGGDNNSGETPESGDNNSGETPEGGGNNGGEASGGDNNGGGPPEGGDNNGGDNGAGDDGSSAEESNEDTQGTDIPEASDSADNRKTTGFRVQTGFFVMPVYASGNAQDALTVGTLTDTASVDGTDTADMAVEGADTNAAQENRVVIEGVTWESDPAYDKDTKGVYTFTPVLPDGYVLLDGVSLPRITVTVGSGMDAVIQALLDRITALPDAQEYMEEEPDIDDWEEKEDAYEEAYEEWMEKLYDYAEEALAIQEEIEKLTQEGQALIPQEALEKLAAWVELAEKVAENGMVMAAAGTHTCNGITFQPWERTDSLPKEGAYYLTANVDVGESIGSAINSGKELRLCLNGNTISGENRNAAIFSVKGGTLNLYDCTGTGRVYCTGDSNPVSVSDGGSFHLYGGTVEHGGDLSAVGVVKGDGNPGSTVDIHGGTAKGGGMGGIGVNEGLTNVSVSVQGGTVTGGSFGVTIKSGTLKVTGGTVTGGTYYGVWVSAGSAATISGGEISGGETGVRVQSGTLKVTGGTVTGGTYYGVWILDGGEVTVSSGEVSGKQVGARVQNGTMTLDGGTVSGDQDGVRAESGNLTVSDGTITGGKDFGVWVTDGGAATINGGKISGRVGVKVESENLKVTGGTITGKTSYSIWMLGNGTVNVAGNVTLNTAIYSTCPNGIIASGTGQSGLSTVYRIQYSDGNVTNDQVIVRGSTDTAHYQLVSGTYGLAVSGGNLVAKGKYTVTYNKNSGTIENEDNYTSYTYSEGLTLPTPTRAGYTFGGWYENSGFSGSKVTAISKTATGNKTYYAKWTANTYTVTYNKNSGEIADESSYTGYTYGTGLTLPTPTRAGYTFGGWYEDSGFSGSKVTSISKTATGNKTYYAKWTVNTYTVTYNKNNGEIADESSYTGYTYGTGLTLPTPTRTGYTFGGWYEDSGFSGSKVTSISKTATGNKTYYAKWTANTYTVTYNGNGSTGGSTADSGHTYGTAKALTANGFTRSYTVTFNPNYMGGSNTTRTAAYTFAGWNTQADGKGTSYTDSQSVSNLTTTNGGKVTLYARWNPATPVSVTYTPTRTNYTFAGWYTGSACSGSRADSDGTYTPAASITLYAKWAGDNYRVTLHKNGGGSGTDLTDYMHGTKTTLPADWTRTGYTFKGWYDNAQCEGEAVTAIPSDAVGEKEYWAKWTDDTAPVIGVLEYSYTPTTLWQWLVGKDSLCITVPVMEEGSGTDVIIYTVTPDGGSQESKVAHISGGKAEITVDAGFKGTISIVCTDRAGNTSAGVTVGAGLSAAGVIIEDHAPRIELKAVDAGLLQTGEYEMLPNISATVSDDKDSVVSSGIASVSYKIGAGSDNPVGNASDYMADVVVNKSFTIQADELSGPETVITVTATDHAGNSSTVSKTIKVHTHSGILTEAKEADCTEDGSLVHYGCACGKMFSDSACTSEITDHASVAITKLGHDYSRDYQYDAEGHWKVCSRCGAADMKQSHNYDNDKDTQCNDCGYKRTIKKSDTGNADEEKPTSAPTQEPEQPMSPGSTSPSGQPTPPGSTNLSGQPTPPGSTNLSGQPKTSGATNPSGQPTAPNPTHSLEQPQAIVVPDDRQGPESGRTSELSEKPSETETGEVSESGREQVVPASIDNGKITISGGLVATGNVEGMACANTVLEVGKGAVIVKVVCAEQEYTAGVADTVAVANAVLAPDHLALVNNGENVEVRIDVKDISNKVPAQDREIIESGIGEYQKDVPGVACGMYLDISVFIKSGDGDWTPVTETGEEIEIVIGIPEHIQGKGRMYVIIRAHDGEHTFLNDMDDVPDTITIHTEMFSSYAIVYTEGEETGMGDMPKCGLCAICPTFLGICYFIWLAVVAAVILLVVIVTLRRKKKPERPR